MLAQFALGGGPELPDFSGALIVLVLVLLAIVCLVAAYFTE